MLGNAGKTLVLLSICLIIPHVAAAENVMEFSLDEADTRSSGKRSKSEPTVDAEAEVAKALGELRWGMSSKEVLAVLKARVRAQFDRQSRLERDIIRQDALYQQAKARFAQIKDSFVLFDEKKNGWDVSPIAAEFRRRSEESMLVVRGAESNDYYFFIHDRLWKWYRELEPSTGAAPSFDGTAEAMRAQFGASAQVAAPRSEDEAAWPGLTWDTTSTRVTLIQRGAVPCVIFEAQSTLAELPGLRQNALARGAHKRSLIDAVLMDSDEREGLDTVDTRHSPVDAITQRRQVSARR